MARPYRRRTVSKVIRAYSLDPLERIESIGGVNSDRSAWTLTQAAAITSIEAGTDEFFFHVSDQPVRLVVYTRGGEKYLQSEREKTHPDELLDLIAPDAMPRRSLGQHPRTSRVICPFSSGRNDSAASASFHFAKVTARTHP